MVAIGRRVYGLGAIALGVPGLVYGSLGAMGLAVPPQLPAYHLLAYAAAAALVAAGLAINLPRVTAIAALMLAAFFGVCVLALYLPNAIAKATVWVSWESVAEFTVMAMGGVLAWTLSTANEARAASVAPIAWRVFGAALVVFGISEFVYARFTASLVPAWLPPSPLFWTYVTGAAQIAAGLAVLSGVQARLAAILLTGMYLVFQLVVHLPRVFADPSAKGVWPEHGVNLVLAGAAWCLADSLTAKPRT